MLLCFFFFLCFGSIPLHSIPKQRETIVETSLFLGFFSRQSKRFCASKEDKGLTMRGLFFLVGLNFFLLFFSLSLEMLQMLVEAFFLHLRTIRRCKRGKFLFGRGTLLQETYMMSISSSSSSSVLVRVTTCSALKMLRMISAGTP